MRNVSDGKNYEPGGTVPSHHGFQCQPWDHKTRHPLPSCPRAFESAPAHTLMPARRSPTGPRCQRILWDEWIEIEKTEGCELMVVSRTPHLKTQQLIHVMDKLQATVDLICELESGDNGSSSARCTCSGVQNTCASSWQNRRTRVKPLRAPDNSFLHSVSTKGDQDLHTHTPVQRTEVSQPQRQIPIRPLCGSKYQAVTRTIHGLQPKNFLASGIL